MSQRLLVIDHTRPRGWRVIAGHESAHAITALVVHDEVESMRIWRDAKGTYRGVFRQQPPEPDGARTFVEISNAVKTLRKDAGYQDYHWVHQRLVVDLAGLAFELGAGERSAFEDAAGDLESARSYADSVCSSRAQRGLMLDVALLQAATTVDHNASVIAALANRLAETTYLCGDDIRAIASSAGYPVPINNREIRGPSVLACLQWRPGALSATPPLQWRAGAII